MSFPPRRGRPSLVDLTRIVDAAVELGTDDFTVAAVARRLDVDDSTLYRYIGDRDRLRALVAARHVESMSVQTSDGSWTGYLLNLALRTRALVIEWPGVANYLLAGPYTTATIAVFDRITDELAARRPDATRRSASLAASRVVCLTAAFSHAGMFDHAHARTTGSDQLELFHWTVDALIGGMDHAVRQGNLPTSYNEPASTRRSDETSADEVNLDI
jgi:AcrR family transcriptional regulator